METFVFTTFFLLVMTHAVFSLRCYHCTTVDGSDCSSGEYECSAIFQFDRCMTLKVANTLQKSCSSEAVCNMACTGMSDCNVNCCTTDLCNN